jgi:hypothetical protein
MSSHVPLRRAEADAVGVTQVTRCQASKNVNVSMSAPIEVTPAQMKSLKLRPVSGAAADSAVALEQLNALTTSGEKPPLALRSTVGLRRLQSKGRPSLFLAPRPLQSCPPHVCGSITCALFCGS